MSSFPFPSQDVIYQTQVIKLFPLGRVCSVTFSLRTGKSTTFYLQCMGQAFRCSMSQVNFKTEQDLLCFLGGISDRDLGLNSLVSTEERERQRELKQKQERRVTNILMGKMREDIEFLGRKSWEKNEKEVDQGIEMRP
jgi:hypothetical protein